VFLVSLECCEVTLNTDDHEIIKGNLVHSTEGYIQLMIKQEKNKAMENEANTDEKLNNVKKAISYEKVMNDEKAIDAAKNKKDEKANNNQNDEIINEHCILIYSHSISSYYIENFLT
jgi:hypothetical protein